MLPVALQERVDPDVKVEPADVEVFERWDIEVVFPIVEPQKEILGFLVLGRKESGELYTREDMEYLGLMSAQAALAMGRIALQEKLILQNAEKEKLEEVSELKSLFVASVSHELKTPLTSIKIMSELLQSGTGLSREKIHEYAHIIEGESDRLTRLINNVLDFSKIERGIKVYSFAEVDLNDIVKDSINVMKYQFELEGFTLRHTQSKVPLTINADKDAIRSALINVLSNAMKYSHNEKVIDVYTFKRERHVGVTIADRGIGIPNEERLRIFDQFYRGESKHTRNVGGLGLGLAIVKHVMDAHGGEINVFSEVGKESKFELLFPAFGDE
jgi:signal transduction histidine kinase